MTGLCCPRCDTQLNKQPDGKLACGACRVNFPVLPADPAAAGVPFLWPEPGATLLDWRNRYNMALADIEQQLNACANTPSNVPAATRKRIDLLQTALERHQTELTELLAPLHVGEALAKEMHLALRTRLPSHHGVLSYAQNIHRDWCWGEAENRLVLEHLLQALQSGGVAPTSILVLGSGAGRLAYDLHRSLQPETTWALDSNPLLCLLGARMSQGDTVEFTEFPLTPVSLTDAAIERTLAAPEAIDGIHFVCADALRLPFAPGGFDLVVTPWLVDVIDAGVNEVLNVVAAALSAGGAWLNHGSIAFQGAQPGNRLSADELAEMTGSGGFEVTFKENVTLPYLQSPASRQQRNEVTYTQLAVRDASTVEPLAARPQHLPDWLVTGAEPVPVTPGIQTQITTTRIHAFIMSLIDGKRSIKDMAKVLEEQRLMPANEATQAIRQFLTTMQEEANRLQGRGGSLD